MKLSLGHFMNRREERRPWIKRLFTGRRLDNIHKGFVFFLVGSSVFFSVNLVFVAVNFYRNVIPERREKREQLEKELLEADKAGF